MRKWITAILIVVVLVIVAFVKVPGPKAAATFKLPDGSVIEVVKVTFGPTHRFRWDNRLRDVLGERLPRKLRDHLGVRVVEVTRANAGSLVLWTRAQGAGGTPINPTVGWGSGRRAQNIQLGMADDHGVEVDVVPKNVVGMPPPTATPSPANLILAVGSSWVFGWEFDVFPRHSKEITLNFYSLTNNQRRKLGDLQLPNPALPATDTWLPESLPAIKPLDDLNVKLVWAETAMSREESELNTSLGLELTRAGMPVTDWMLSQFELFTEGGSIPYRARTQRTDAQTGMIVTAISSGLWPDQPWKLRFWFERTANFPTNELWRLEDIPAIVEPPQTRRFGDWSVNISNDRETFARGENSLPNLWRTPSSGLILAFSGPYYGTWRLNLLHARDDQRRKLALIQQGEVRGMELMAMAASPAPWNFRTYRFSLLPGAASSSFTFTIHRLRPVEFVVKPHRLQGLDNSKVPGDRVSGTPNYLTMGAFYR